mmetsp:Transcript_61654/g.177467  ORF Transcript_61654/g.177467 Transcript_61654/m.177467 type:complete len:89 (-) Transcript_61654:1233-1499(-)
MAPFVLRKHIHQLRQCPSFFFRAHRYCPCQDEESTKKGWRLLNLLWRRGQLLLLRLLYSLQGDIAACVFYHCVLSVIAVKTSGGIVVF